MIQQTGVHGVSVARGCIGNPWIFNQARALMDGKSPLLPTVLQQRTALLEHIALCTQLHGEKKGSRLMRKFGIQFSKFHPQSEDVRKRFIQSQTLLEWETVIEEFYSSSNL